MIPLDADLVRGEPIRLSAPREPVEGAAQDWMGVLIRAVDRGLRHWMKIGTFCTDRSCVMRLAVVQASDAVALADGTRIEPGDPVGELHLWNEQLPPMPWSGPGLAWALTMRRRIDHSLARLADHIEQHTELVSITAFRGTITFGGGPRRAAQLARVAARYGFEVVAPQRAAGRVHQFFDSVFVRLLIRAFNPAALRKPGLMRYRHELWISRRTLIARRRQRLR